MEQKGEETTNEPFNYSDEEEEEEHQRNMLEVRTARQLVRAREKIRDEIIQRNIDFRDETTQRNVPLLKPLAEHISSQRGLLQTLRDIQLDPKAEGEMTDEEFIDDIMNTSQSAFPKIYEIYEAHQSEGLQ